MIDWKLLELFGSSDVVTEVKYLATASDNQNSVQSEGYWKFAKPINLAPETLEIDLIRELDKDATIIKDNLNAQLAVKPLSIAIKPWEKPIFKVNF
jgi:hypothetical protein